MNINSLSLQIYTVIIKLAVGSERERERAVDRSRPSRIFHAPQKCPPSLPLPPCNKRPSRAARFCVCEQDHRYDSAGALLTRGASIRAIRGGGEEASWKRNRRVTRCFETAVVREIGRDNKGGRERRAKKLFEQKLIKTDPHRGGLS